MNLQRKKLYRFLNKKLRLDSEYLIHGGLWLTGHRFVNGVSSILLAVMFANFLPQTTYGVYKYVIAVGGMLSAFTLTGLVVSLKISAAKNRDGSLLQAYTESLRWSWLLFSAAISLSGYYYFQGDIVLAVGMLFVAFCKPAMSAGGLYISFLDGQTAFIRKSILGMLHVVTTSALMIAAVYLTNNILILFSVYFISHALIYNLFFLYTHRKVRSNDDTDKSLVSYAKHLSLMSILPKISMQLDKILLFQNIGSAQLAIYSFAMTPVTELQEGNSTLKKLIFPKLAQKNLQEIKEKLPSKMLLILLASGAMTVGYWFVSPILFKYAFPQYVDSVVYSQVMSLSLLFFVRMPAMQVLILQKAKRYLYIINTTTPITRIALLLLLVPTYGLWGAVFSMLLTELILTILILYFYRKL